MKKDYELTVTAGELLMIATALEEAKLSKQDQIDDATDDIKNINGIIKKIITAFS